MYPALLRTPDGAAERALLAAVAPGGTLLLVHHAGMETHQAHEGACNPADFVSVVDGRGAPGRRTGTSRWTSSGRVPYPRAARVRTTSMTWCCVRAGCPDTDLGTAAAGVHRCEP